MANVQQLLDPEYRQRRAAEIKAESLRFDNLTTAEKLDEITTCRGPVVTITVEPDEFDVVRDFLHEWIVEPADDDHPTDALAMGVTNENLRANLDKLDGDTPQTLSVLSSEWRGFAAETFVHFSWNTPQELRKAEILWALEVRAARAVWALSDKTVA